SLLLALAGGALGAALAFPGLKAILALVPPETIPDESEAVINSAVLLFTLGVSIATALLFGLAPAFHTSRLLVGRSPRRSRASAALVVAEVALSLMLLAGASLMI